jgi:uncharacterized phage-associated protein
MNEDLKAFASANYILTKLQEKGIVDITNLKLQKLLYFAFGIHLVLYDNNLFDANIQAWRLGPVVPSVYREFKNFGSSPIASTSKARIVDEGTGAVTTPDETFFTIQENAIHALDIACEYYGQKKAWDLVNITHQEKTSAWYKVWSENSRGKNLNNQDIKDEFMPLLKKIHNKIF